MNNDNYERKVPNESQVKVKKFMNKVKELYRNSLEMGMKEIPIEQFARKHKAKIEKLLEDEDDKK